MYIIVLQLNNIVIQNKRIKLFEEFTTVNIIPFLIHDFLKLFHETVAVGLLQKILFYEDGVQSLGNYALDLFDHIIFSITHLAVG